MAEFQWWLLLVGLVAGGGLVAVVSMDGKRREQDLGELERRAEANWIVDRMADSAQWIDRPTVEAVLGFHRDYLGDAAAGRDPGGGRGAAAAAEADRT